MPYARWDGLGLDLQAGSGCQVERGKWNSFCLDGEFVSRNLVARSACLFVLWDLSGVAASGKQAAVGSELWPQHVEKGTRKAVASV